MDAEVEEPVEGVPAPPTSEGGPGAGDAEDAPDGEPLHRVVSAWAVSTVCGALLGGGVAAAAFALIVGREVALFAGAAWLVALAVCAPVEAAAAIVRRGTRGAVGLLVLLPPPAVLVLVAVGSAWVEAFALGDLAGTFERAARALASQRVSLERFAEGCLPIGLVLVPLTTARAVKARMLVTCGVSGAAPAVLSLVLLVVDLAGRRQSQGVTISLTAPAALLALCVVTGAAGLCLGDRLEPRLASWLDRRLRP